MYDYLIGPSVAGFLVGFLIQILMLVLFGGLFKGSVVDQFVYVLPGFVSVLIGPLVSWFASRRDWRPVVISFIALFLVYAILWFIFGPDRGPKLTL